MPDFLRRCPACGRRFSVRRIDERLVNTEEGTERVDHDVAVPVYGPNARVIPAGTTSEDIPIIKETFETTYECRSCHHKWTETTRKVEKTA